MTTEWHDAAVVSIRPAADELFHFNLDVRGTPLAALHLHPGQYVKLALAGYKEGFFAIASAPGSATGVLDFLIKQGAPLADALRGLSKADKVQVSAPLGKGFPLDKAKGKRLLLFATGSGISAIRSVIDGIRSARKEYGPVTLYFGARTPDAFAYHDEFEHWKDANIRVVRTVSKPGASGWQGLTGYVQAHLGEMDLTQTLAFLCGQKGMVQAVTEELVRRGVAREDIHLNF